MKNVKAGTIVIYRLLVNRGNRGNKWNVEKFVKLKVCKVQRLLLTL